MIFEFKCLILYSVFPKVWRPIKCWADRPTSQMKSRVKSGACLVFLKHLYHSQDVCLIRPRLFKHVQKGCFLR